jgi:hypothetical protein
MDNIVDDDWGGEDPHGEGISAWPVGFRCQPVTNSQRIMVGEIKSDRLDGSVDTL